MSNHAQGLACPACRVDLVMTERAGVEIDYCPKCRGVWLDRGELDKIIERGSQFEARAVAPQPQPQPQPQYVPQPQPQYVPQPQSGPFGGGHYQSGGHPGGGYGYKKKRKNWLEEIFD